MSNSKRVDLFEGSGFIADSISDKDAENENKSRFNARTIKLIHHIIIPKNNIYKPLKELTIIKGIKYE